MTTYQDIGTLLSLVSMVRKKSKVGTWHPRPLKSAPNYYIEYCQNLQSKIGPNASITRCRNLVGGTNWNNLAITHPVSKMI